MVGTVHDGYSTWWVHVNTSGIGNCEQSKIEREEKEQQVMEKGNMRVKTKLLSKQLNFLSHWNTSHHITVMLLKTGIRLSD